MMVRLYVHEIVEDSRGIRAVEALPDAGEGEGGPGVGAARAVVHGDGATWPLVRGGGPSRTELTTITW